MRRTGKAFGTLAAALSLAMVGSGVAYADNIKNDVTTVDGVTSRSITTATETTVNYYVQATGGSCDAADGSALTLTINAPTAVTKSAPSLRFTNCGAAHSQPVTFSSTTPGSYSITVSTSDSTGSYNANGAAFTLSVSAAPPSNTAPQVSVTGVTDGATYEFGSVPSAGCSVTDAEDANESATPQSSEITGPLAGYGLGSRTVTCSYTDGGGLSGSASATYTIGDTGAPVVTSVGPTASATGANGWYTSTVTNTFRASDSGAGFTSPLANPHTFTKSSGTNEGPAVTINSGTVADVAGNVSSALNSTAFKIDLSNPTDVAFVGGPTSGSTHYFGSVPASPTCTADDAVSGLAGCVVSGYSTSVGQHTLIATATDNSGRTATATRTYTVSAWTASGFYSPVDMNGTLNTVKNGSTVPLKFEVFAGSELTDVAAITSFTQRVITCDGSAPTDEVEITSTGGTILRYDSTGGQFIQNWQTPKKVGACYQVTVTMQDGSVLSANFKLR